MRLVSLVCLAACAMDVQVVTRATADAPMTVSVHDADGQLVEEITTGLEGVASFESVPRDGLVTVTSVQGDPPWRIWSESVGGVRPGDRLTMTAVEPWPPPEAEPILRSGMSVSSLPPAADSAWMALFECAVGRTIDTLRTEVTLNPCEGWVTPVALALNSAAIPIRFQVLEPVRVEDLSEFGVSFEGPWRNDWDLVELRVDGPVLEPVVATFDMGVWSAFEIRDSTPFTLVYPVPPGLDLPGTLAVEMREWDQRLYFEYDVRAGDAVEVDLAAFVPAVDARWRADDRDYRLEVEADRTVESLFFEVAGPQSVPQITWQGRLPADSPPVLPGGFFPADALEGGFGTLALGDHTGRGFGHVRPDGLGSAIRRGRSMPLGWPE